MTVKTKKKPKKSTLDKWDIYKPIVFLVTIWYNYFMMKRKKLPDNCKCIHCGKSFRTNPAYLKRRNGVKYCSVSCMWEYRRSHVKPYMDSGGYLTIRRQRVHRTIMEKHLGRKLASSEHVHHIDGDRLNNDINNLEILSASKHHKKHPTQRTTGYYTDCLYCGKEIYTTPVKALQFCSHSCYWKAKKGTWQKKLKVTNEKT